MAKLLIIISMCITFLAFPCGAVQKKAVRGQNATVADTKDMHIAAISRTNPFEVVASHNMVLREASSSDMDEVINDLVALAKKHIGTRYVRGGKTPKGFDCSGFTSYVFGQFGINLGNSSSSQYTQGEKILREEITTGDLLFFTGRNSKSGRVGHVGIALSNDPETGEITFIHAAIGGGIKIDRISAPYYSTRYLGARRVL